MGAIATYSDALAELCRGAGVTANPAVVAELIAEYRLLTRHAYGTENGEIRQVLQELRTRGLKLAIVTNANDLDVELFESHSLAPCFDAFVASCRVGLRKP